MVLLLTGLTHIHDVGEEVVVVRLGHGVPEFLRVLEQADKDHEAVEVAVLRRDHLEYRLRDTQQI